MTRANNTSNLGQYIRDYMMPTQNRSQLNLVTNKENSSIIIKKNHHLHPFSWFITGINGQLKLSGRFLPNDLEIKLSGLETGQYQFRAQGEVFDFNLV